MYTVEIKNCNNIRSGKITIAKDRLNIKYGINGTGKTTISRAIEISKDSEKLQELKSYFSDERAEVTVTPKMSKILFFNEEFVEQVVFKEDEVIENSFEVFLKTSDYDQKKDQLDSHLLELKDILSQDNNVIAFRDLLNRVDDKL